MNAIITHGVIPSENILVDEPNILIQSLTVTPQRTETRHRGPNRATQGITEVDPVIDFAITGLIKTVAGLADGHPGEQLIELLNYQASLHGFAPTDGIIVYRDPSRSHDTENPDSVTLTVTHFPFVLKGWGVILAPAGDDNDIKISSADPTILTAQIVIDDTTDRTQLTAAKSGSALVATSGDKRVMRIVADFTDEEIPVVETVDLINNSSAEWYSEDNVHALTNDGFFWVLDKTGAGKFTLPYTTPFPDEEDWSEAVPSDGSITNPIPTVTAHPATAAQVIAALSALPGITATNAPGNDGTGFVAAVGPVSFAGI
jgi:hypothetical protein